MTIPKASRPGPSASDNALGPGHYNISRDIVGKERGTFGKDKRKMGDELQDPVMAGIGPGLYTITDETFAKNNGKGYTILGKPRAQSANPGSRLGPGQYHRNTEELANEAYSFGKTQRKGLTFGVDNKVGPGQYGNLRDKTFGKKGISFGKSTRNQVKVDNPPGPGHYCGQKSKAARPVVSAGTFGTAERKIGDRLRETGCAKNLGPGSYSVKTDKKTGWSFGNQARGANEGKFNNPMGPGSYNIPSKLSQKGGLIGTGLRTPASKGEKGVGHYSTPASFPDAPKYLLPPKEQRKIHM